MNSFDFFFYFTRRRYLGTGTSLRSLAFSFRMGKTTVAEIVHETVVAIWEELQPLHMPVPSEENLRSVAEDFFSIWNFLNCVGAIDGKHVPIRCPSNSGSMFFNYKKILLCLSGRCTRCKIQVHKH